MSARLRWKKRSGRQGLARIGAPHPGFELHDGSERFATVLQWRSDEGAARGWYWVIQHARVGCPPKNTCATPNNTADEAKAEALAFVKACIAKGESVTPSEGTPE